MAERELSLKELQEENLRIQNEHLREQTEFYREQNEVARSKRAQRQMMHADGEKALSEGRVREAAVQNNCTHLKGGKGDDLANNQGDGQKGGHSIVKHLHSWGEWQVLCTRCRADWWPGDTEENHPTGISFATAIKWPTDNSSSGSAQFRIDPAVIQRMRVERIAARWTGLGRPVPGGSAPPGEVRA